MKVLLLRILRHRFVSQMCGYIVRRDSMIDSGTDTRQFQEFVGFLGIASTDGHNLGVADISLGAVAGK